MSREEQIADLLKRLQEQKARYVSNGTIGRLLRDASELIKQLAT